MSIQAFTVAQEPERTDAAHRPTLPPVQGLTAAQAYREADTLFRSNIARTPQGALDARDRLLSLAYHAADEGLIGDALLWHHQTLLFLGRHRQAQSARDASRAIAERLNDAARIAACDIWDAQVLRMKGLYLESLAKIRHALPLLAAHRDPARIRQRALMIVGNVYTSLGLWEQAIDSAEESMRLAVLRDDEPALFRSLYDELYSRFSRAEARHQGAPEMPAGDADLVRVESQTRARLQAFDPHGSFAVASNFAFIYRQLLFQVLASSGREPEALAWWQQTAHIPDRYRDPLQTAQVAFHREGARRACEILIPAIDDAEALTASDRAKAWCLLAKAHEQLGDHGAALRALREHMKLELSQSRTSAKVQAALLAHELEAEREKLLSQRALIHAGKLAAVGQLASSMAHEVAQPSAALMLLGADARAALNGQDWELLREVLGDMEQQTARLNRLVNGMKTFSRDEPLHMQTLDLRDVVDEAHRLCRPAINAAKVSCVQGVPPLKVHADKERVILTLVNLVNNALDAMRGQVSPAPTLRIDAAMQESQVRLSVIDNGPGLSDDAMAHLSQTFFTTKSTGLGLGLTITREALAGMGARLEIGNGPGGGAQISVLLRTKTAA